MASAWPAYKAPSIREPYATLYMTHDLQELYAVAQSTFIVDQLDISVGSSTLNATPWSKWRRFCWGCAPPWLLDPVNGKGSGTRSDENTVVVEQVQRDRKSGVRSQESATCVVSRPPRLYNHPLRRHTRPMRYLFIHTL